MSRLYLRPLGFLYGPAAKTGLAEGFALPVAGGPVAFTLAEVIEGEPGSSKRRMMTASDLSQTKDSDLYAAIGQVTAPRAGFAGISAERLSSGRPLLMGIVNVTPDSFSDGGLFDQKEPAVNHAAELIQAGAEIVDIGGESTRPGSEAVPGEDELSRVIPVLEDLHGVKAVISVDTRKAEVARAAAEQGATIFNDVSALTFDEKSLETAVETGMAVVLMHAQGEPKTMQKNPTYEDVVLEVYDYLAERIAAVSEAGVPKDRIVADPGVGFGKDIDHNLDLLAHLSIFHGLGVPVLVGASRKRFIEGVIGEKNPRNREPGSQAIAISSASQGVQIMRVHDVAATRQALEVWHGSVTGRPEKA
ncbi:dihydropteroate synthase [Methyloligella solikamskensis]|uniref:dihydropteroate synthase n=1 Tax=Methyloligella solikamskensis TaxID=1177756 RepID=A0ABW3J8Q4_9HYPH